jgi:hypothetical protein
MAIQNYSRPQSVIRQIFAITPQQESDRINAVIVGPNYHLQRYTNSDERAEIEGVTFSSAGQDVPYENRPGGSTIDTSYTELYGEELDAKLAEFESDSAGELEIGTELEVADNGAFGIANGTDTYPVEGGSGSGAQLSIEVQGGSIVSATVTVSGGSGYQIGDAVQANDAGGIGIFGEFILKSENFVTAGTSVFSIEDLAAPSRITISNTTDATRGVLENSNTNLDPRFEGRDVQVGDIVKITDPRGDRTRTVVAIENLLTEASFGSDEARANGEASNSSTNARNQGNDSVDVQTVPTGWDLDFLSEEFSDPVGGPIYNGRYGDLFVITCTRAGGEIGGAGTEAEFSIRSNSGLYAADNVEIDKVGGKFRFQPADEALFQGLEFEITAPVGVTTFTQNDQFIFIAKAKYTRLDMSTVVGQGHLTISGTYTGKKDTVYSIQVSEGSGGVGSETFSGATIKIFDSTGVDQLATVSNIVAGDGLKFTFNDLFGSGENPVPQGGLRAGDIYSVAVSASKPEGAASIVVLNGSAVSVGGLNANGYILDKVEFFKRFSGKIDQKENLRNAWESTNADLVVENNLSLFVEGRTPGLEWVPFQDGQGTLFASYRALQPPSVNEQFIKINNVNDIVDAWGKIDQDNPIAYGALVAFSGSQGKPIFGSAVPEDTPEGYSEILREASNRDDLYVFAPLTYDRAVQDIFKAHVEAMSTEFKKQWRRVYVATEAVAEFGKLTVQSDDTVYTATIIEDVSGGFIRVITENADFVTADIKKGDLFRTNYRADAFGGIEYDEYVIEVVLNEEELILETGPSQPITEPQKFEAWGADNGANQAARVAAISESFGKRRVTNIWCDGPETIIGDEFVPQPVYFIAAEIAGLRSAQVPQQGLTFTEVESVARAIPMFSKYTQEELDIAAAAGTFIITQEVKDSPVFIRHQLTTETDKGSLFYEDNVGVNADEISYATKDFVQPFIGRRNAVPETVAALRTGWENLLLARTTAPAFLQIGPQIIAITPDSLEVFIDPTFKDRVNMKVQLQVPLPLNRVEVDISFTTILN